MRVQIASVLEKGEGRGRHGSGVRIQGLQGYFAHKKQPSPPGKPQGPRHGSAVGSKGAAVSYDRGTPGGRIPRRLWL